MFFCSLLLLQSSFRLDAPLLCCVFQVFYRETLSSRSGTGNRDSFIIVDELSKNMLIGFKNREPWLFGRALGLAFSLEAFFGGVLHFAYLIH